MSNVDVKIILTPTGNEPSKNLRLLPIQG